MKIKLTLRYVLSVAATAIIVVGMNALIAFLLVIFMKVDSNNESRGRIDLSDLVRSFEYYIEDNNGISLSDKGKELIDEKNLWIQILDEDNKEVYNYKKPEVLSDKYTPIEIINWYKYGGGLGEVSSQILVGYTDINNITYTYLIGFSKVFLQKFVFIMDTDTMIGLIKYSMIIMIIVDFIIALIIGYIFSKGLFKPVTKSIDYIEDLYSGNYNKTLKEKGIYSNVFNKLNGLANKLKENEIEREKLDTARNEWIANISHDIKTPLSSIKGYAEVLSEDYEFTSDEIKDYANIINSKSDYIKSLLDDLNLNMKLKNNQSVLNKEDTNIVSLVKGCVIDILNDANYRDSNISFNTTEDRIIKNVDKKLIQRVINNLIYNALIHNNKEVVIKVRIYKNEKIHIIIEDNGKGISEEDLENIFNRYYRGTNTGDSHKGSGLGMSIAKEIVNAHNGEIKVSSKLFKGTKMEIIL